MYCLFVLQSSATTPSVICSTFVRLLDYSRNQGIFHKLVHTGTCFLQRSGPCFFITERPCPLQCRTQCLLGSYTISYSCLLIFWVSLQIKISLTLLINCTCTSNVFLISMIMIIDYDL